MTWQTMPTFTDGVPVEAADLSPLRNNLLELQNADRVARGNIVATSGALVSGVTTTETNITQLAMSAITVDANRFYVFNLQAYCQGSVAGDSFFFRIRQNTALTGGVIVSVPLVISKGLVDDTKFVSLPWKSPSSGSMVFYTSVQRLAGTGTLAVYGDSKTAAWIERKGDDGSVWTLT